MSLSKQNMIHIGAEIIVISALGVYFYKRDKINTQKIKNLEENIKLLQEKVMQLQDSMITLYNMSRQQPANQQVISSPNIIQAPNTQAPNTQVPNTQVPNTQVPNTQMTNTQMTNTQVPNMQSVMLSQPVAQTMFQKYTSVEDNTLSNILDDDVTVEENLDDEIKEELAELK